MSDNEARMRQFSATIKGGNTSKESVDLSELIKESNSKYISVITLSPNAKIPTKAFSSDAGWDLYSTQSKVILSGQRDLIKTGIALAIPEGYAGLIWPRSGLAVKKGVDVLAGVIDSGYRGEIQVSLLNTDGYNPVEINQGDRIAQIIIQPVSQLQMVSAESLDNTDRAEGGFGSSGS